MDRAHLHDPICGSTKHNDKVLDFQYVRIFAVKIENKRASPPLAGLGRKRFCRHGSRVRRTNQIRIITSSPVALPRPIIISSTSYLPALLLLPSFLHVNFSARKQSCEMGKPSYNNCFAVSPECPISGTLYGYSPNLGANVFFAALFGTLLLAQIIIGSWTRTWTYMLAVGLGVFGEMVGYIGRLIMHKNPWSNGGFEMQICCLVLAPSFLAAGIYLTLKHMVLYLGPEYSRMKAKWYPWIFVGSDLGSIIIQAIGGGVAASAKNGSNRSLLSAGDALIITGIALQSVTMFICGSVVLDFVLRRRKARTDKAETEGAAPPSMDATALPNDASTTSPLQFRIFCWAIGFSFLTILIRCIYRIPEMAGGWGNPRMRDEPTFLVLDGGMVALASISFTVAHPGFMFPRMRRSKKTNLS
jgi:hypothetical protein